MGQHGHKRDTDARSTRFRLPKAPYLAGAVAVAATLSAVGAGVLAASPETRDLLAANTSSSIGHAAAPVDMEERQQVVSRDASRIERMTQVEMMMRPEIVERAVRNADTRLWTTTDLNLWTGPGAEASEVGLLEGERRVLVTGREAVGRTEVVIDGHSRWVTSGYLTDEKPRPERTTEADSGSDSGSGTPGLGGACTNGTSVEGQPNVLAVHEAVCAAFPEITTYGTYRADGGEHAQGLAIDIMVSGSRGWEVAEFVRAHYAELGVNYIMYSQRIWSVDRASEGWRYVEDRGSVTANHYDHVHVTTY